MGFKKTENGNLVYDFDFVPTKVIPLRKSECGYDRCYAAEDDNGNRAPVFFSFQGNRHGQYAIVFGFLPNDTRRENEFGQDVCVCANRPLVATFAKLNDEWQNSWDEQKDAYGFDPTLTDSLADAGVTFPLMSVDDSAAYIETNSIPKAGYDILRQRMS